MNSKSRHFDGETQWNSNLFQRTFGGLYFQPNGATSKGVRVDQPQHCVRIGNRSGLTSPSVAGGPWLRTSACRADLNILEHVNRSEERRVGQECVSTRWSRWSTAHL